MSLNPRVLLGPDVVRVSRRGVNAKTPPSLTPNHLVVDSSWEKVERLHSVQVVLSNNLLNPVTLRYTAASELPFAAMIRRTPGTFKTHDIIAHVSDQFVTSTIRRRWLDQRHTIAEIRVASLELIQQVRRVSGLRRPDNKLWDFIVLVFKP